MTEPMKLVLTGKQSIRFADVVWKNAIGTTTANICDVCDGKTKAPSAVKKFAKSWVDTFTA